MVYRDRNLITSFDVPRSGLHCGELFFKGMAAQEVKIRDLRIKEKFPVDDTYLNGYARLVGVYATAVYLSLCRHADKGQKSFPSIERIAQEHNISVASVKRGINALLKWGIIYRVRLGKRLRNEYHLLDKSEWVIAPTEPSQGEGDSSHRAEVIAPTELSDSSHRAYKDTQVKDTHKKDKESPNGDSEAPPDKPSSMIVPDQKTEVIEYTKALFGLSMLDDSEKWNRIYAGHLINKCKGLDKAKLVIQLASQNPYWSKRITKIKDLWANCVAIVNDARNKKPGAVKI